MLGVVVSLSKHSLKNVSNVYATSALFLCFLMMVWLLAPDPSPFSGISAPRRVAYIAKHTSVVLARRLIRMAF